MSCPLYRLLADRIENRNCKGSVVMETLPTHPLYISYIPLLFLWCFRFIEVGAILLLTTAPNVAGETCLANLLQRSGFEAARHIAPSLRLFVPNSLMVCHLLFLLRVVLCDVLLPMDRFLRGDHSPTATPATSLRALILSS
jgi:hypothetical protein